MPDRGELDKVVFEAVGLTKEEQLEVYRAVVELVKNRTVIRRARRFQKIDKSGDVGKKTSWILQDIVRTARKYGMNKRTS